MTMKQDDGTELPTPTTRIHNHEWDWAKGGRASCSVHEHDYGAFVMLTCAGSSGDAAVCASRLLGGIIALRLQEDYALLCADASSAFLVKKPHAHDTL